MTVGETDALVEGISRWVACESPSSDAAAVNRMMDLAAADIGNGPLAVERIAGRDGAGDALVVRAGSANGVEPVLVLSHLDTVHPLGTIERDLPMRREGDRLYGPGVLDMKGGAFIALAALKAAAGGGALPRPVVHIFTPDEEIGSVTTRPLIEHHARGAAHVLVTEPARPGGRVVTARRGSGRYKVRLRGVPAHSGNAHEAGRSAIREACHQILEIEALTDYPRGIAATVGLVSGGTAMNTMPEHAWFSVDLRMTEPDDADRLDRLVHSLSPKDPDIRIEVEGRITRPPYRKDHGIARLHDRARAIGRELGLELDDLPLAGGGSDGNFTAALGIPTLDGLGIEGAGAHTLEEHAIVSTVPQRAALFHALLTCL